MSEAKQVTKDEFDDFIQSYGKPLERDVAGMYEPPVLTYNDFSDGSIWPESVVAYVCLYEAYKEQNRYFIKE